MMKKLFVIGLVLFWTGVTALLAAGLIIYETTKPDTGSVQDVTANENTNNASADTMTLTTDLVATHNSKADCWIIIDEKVYNVTEYVPFHPGGEETILNSCGADATKGFYDRDGQGTPHSAAAKAQLQRYLVGAVGIALEGNPTTSSTDQNTTEDTDSDPNITLTTPAPSTPVVSQPSAPTQTTVNLTAAEVAKHNRSSDCWMIIDNKVYDVTEYIPFHPGGQRRIIDNCGTDSTGLFNGTVSGGHRHNNSARNTLARYLVGSLGGSTTQTTSTQTGSTQSNSTTQTSGAAPSDPIKSAILAAYPGASVLSIAIEDDGRSEVKFSWNGRMYEAKLNSQNVIVDVDG